MKRTLFIFSILVLGMMLVGCDANTVKRNSREVNKEITCPSKDIDKLDIQVSSANVNFILEDREDFKAHVHGRSSRSGDVDLTMATHSKSTLNVKVKVESGIGISYSELTLDIYVPKNYNKDVKIKSSSGDVFGKDMTLNKLAVDVRSGDTTLNNINSKTFQFNSSSGGFVGENITSENTQYSLSSGDMVLKKFSGKLKGQSRSGGVHIEFNELNNDVDLQSSSGDIKLILPQDSEFKLYSKVSSGDISCNRSITLDGKNKKDELNGIVGDGKHTIKLKASSGDINIE